MIWIEEIPVERIDEFWSLHMKYLVDDGIIEDEEDIEYFAGDEYRGIIRSHMIRKCDRHHMVYFVEDGQRIGAAQYNTYQSEDGKCFILDFWVFPAYRGKGKGHACFEALSAYTRADGAKHYEINSEKENAIRFWTSLGFVRAGTDEYGMPLFVLKAGHSVHTVREMILETERLRIRILDQDEMQNMIARTNDPELKKAYGEMLQGSLEHPAQWEWYAAWNIEGKDGETIGDLCFKGLGADGRVEIGYGILEEQQGRGYATEAVAAAVEWALAQPGVTRVEAETDPDNKASQRVLEKCGFKPSGIMGEEGPRFFRTRAEAFA